MRTRLIGALAGLLLLTAQAAVPQPASPSPSDSVDALARDVGRLESFRTVKDVQRAYAHFGQYGLWDATAALLADNATLDWGDQRVSGKAAIRDWLRARGGGQTGLPKGALNTELIDEPLVNLSADGNSAKGRWMALAFRGDGKGRAWFEGGTYENDYTRTPNGWKIAAIRYFPLFEGPYADGWSNAGGKDLPLFPYHFTVDETGIPIPAANGAAAASGATLASLNKRIAALNDEDAVRNLQSAYGYYVDRRMWDDVVDLFAADSAATLNGRRFAGKAGVRRAIETMGPQGLTHGVLNEHPLFDVMVKIRPDGHEAESRGIELAMLGEADKGKASWEINVFHNRFVKEGGIWKLKEMRVTPLMRADYASGWGKGVLAGAAPAFPADFILPGPAASAAIPAPASDLADARRRYSRSLAYEGAENVTAAYGYYIDDFQWKEMADIISLKGNKQSPFAGYYLGRDRIMGAVNASWGRRPSCARRFPSTGAPRWSSTSRMTAARPISARACSSRAPARTRQARRPLSTWAGCMAACTPMSRPCWRTASGGCGASPSTSIIIICRPGRRAGPARRTPTPMRSARRARS